MSAISSSATLATTLLLWPLTVIWLLVSFGMILATLLLLSPWDAAPTFLSSLLTYLPNPGFGLDLYLQALAATNDLIKSAPRDFKYMFLGCDGNCKLLNHGDLDHVIGPFIFPDQSVRSGGRERSEAFIALALEHSLRVANSFRPARRPACENAPTGLTGEELSETWAHFLYPNPRVHSQIDWIPFCQTREASA